MHVPVETDRSMYCSICKEKINSVEKRNKKLSTINHNVCTRCAPEKEMPR